MANYPDPKRVIPQTRPHARVPGAVPPPVRGLKPVKVAEAPVVEAPVAEAPVAEAPVAEAPVAEAPVVEAPVVEAPVEVAEPVVAEEATTDVQSVTWKPVMSKSQLLSIAQGYGLNVTEENSKKEILAALSGMDTVHE